MSVNTIRVLTKEAGKPFVPPPDDYEVRSKEWVETEYHCFTDPSGKVLCAVWEGQPGIVYLGQWPYDEVCILLAGRVALEDEDGGRREFQAGDSFVVPRTFSGTWETIEAARKIFIAINTPGGSS